MNDHTYKLDRTVQPHPCLHLAIYEYGYNDSNPTLACMIPLDNRDVDGDMNVCLDKMIFALEVCADLNKRHGTERTRKEMVLNRPALTIDEMPSYDIDQTRIAA